MKGSKEVRKTIVKNWILILMLTGTNENVEIDQSK